LKGPDVTITGSFQTGLETTICRWVQGQRRYRRPFIPDSFVASMVPWTGWVGTPKLSLPLPWGSPL